MIRQLIEYFARRHDRMLPKRPNERGIDHMRRNLAAGNKRLHRRVRRKAGEFPWLGMGRIWRWLYAPYDENTRREFEEEEKQYLSTLGPTDYTRYMVRRQGFERKILPPCPIPPEELK